MKSNIFKSNQDMNWITAFCTCCLLFIFTSTSFAQDVQGTPKDYLSLFSSKGKDLIKTKTPLLMLYVDKHGDNPSNAEVHVAADGMAKSPLNKEDQISALFIPQGYYVEFFEHRGYSGPKWTFSSGYYPDLWTGNDKFSSMKIHEDKQDPPNGTGIPKNCVMLFESGNPATARSWNRCQGFIGEAGPGQTGEYFGEWHSENSIDVQDKFKYAYIKGAYTMTVWDNANFDGKSIVLKDTDRKDDKGTWVNLGNYGMADRISSAKVSGGAYTLAEFNLGDVIKEQPGKLDETTSLSSAIENGSDVRETMTISIGSSSEDSWSISNWQETTAGVSATVTIGTEGTLAGTVGPNYEIALETSLSTAIGSDKTTGRVDATEVGTEVNVSPNAGCWGGARLSVSPTKVFFKPTLVYKEIDDDGVIVPGGDSYEERVDLMLNFAKKGEAKIHTFCPDDIIETMTNNAWKVDGSNQSMFSGSFKKDGRANLKWTNGSGNSLTLTPDWKSMRFKTSDGKAFDIYTRAGKLESLGYDGKFYHHTPIPGGGNTDPKDSGGDLTVKGGDIETTLLSKTFKLTNATNGYHEGTFTKLADGNLQWQNKANVKWALKPMYASNYLDTTVGDCFYKTHAGGDKFTLIMENGQLKGFKFMRDTFYVVN